jgi:hypothetical protein
LETPAGDENMNWRLWLILGLGAAAALGLACRPPIPQDPKYHSFADQRRMLGRLHALNVWSNISFIGVGIVGLIWLIGHDVPQQWIWASFFVGVVLTGLGSGYYHLRPTNEALVWDRLGMTTAFAPFFAGILAARVGEQAGLWLFGPLLVLGLGTVWYWKRTDDLRPYVWVQFSPMLVIPLMAWLLPARYLETQYIFIVIGWYAVAKVFEAADGPFLRWTGMSGHSWKHLFAAAGCGWVLVALAR